MPQACRLELPLLPSLNNAYVNVPGRGRVASKALKAWKEAAGWALKMQPRAQFAGPFKIVLMVPEKARADTDNYLKAAIDLLVTYRVTPDDRFAQSVTSERSKDVRSGECIIIVEAA